MVHLFCDQFGDNPGRYLLLYMQLWSVFQTLTFIEKENNSKSQWLKYA